jgi:glycosyltransferase involved in cell wall biosynthesis
MESYLEQTIQSVLSQNFSNLEYIVVDGGSTDKSVDIIKKYANRISYWVSEKDGGMYDAIQKGFEASTGEVMGWINADDILLPGCLNSVYDAFINNPNVNWLQGLRATIDTLGRTRDVHQQQNANRFWFLNEQCFDKTGKLRLFGTLQQEGTFWRRSLWEAVNGLKDNKYKLAGDFYLWMKFFRTEVLYHDDCLHAAFRYRPDQASARGRELYESEMRSVILDELSRLSNRERRQLAGYRLSQRYSLLKVIPAFRRLNRIISRRYTTD